MCDATNTNRKQCKRQGTIATYVSTTQGCEYTIVAGLCNQHYEKANKYGIQIGYRTYTRKPNRGRSIA